MDKTQLQIAFEHLSQHSADSVQTGIAFSKWDEYMHVDRPIEDTLMQKMDELDAEGGGIIFLIGSAGDGKSHLISRIKQMSDWPEQSFYNDATACHSPHVNAVVTLNQSLESFMDVNIATTTEKLVLAINLGRLNALLEDEFFKNHYGAIVSSLKHIFDDDANTHPVETSRIKAIMFTDEQAFEFHASDCSEYPVSADFLHKLLDKVVAPKANNPFYAAYKKDIDSGISTLYPLVLNYKLLCIDSVRDAICQTVIEAIIRFKLCITTREFLDFIYSIVVFPHLAEYQKKTDFFEALLPTLLFKGENNRIQIAIGKLDPLKIGCTDHDKELSKLFTSYSIPENYFESISLPTDMIEQINAFYSNAGRDIERTTKFIFRLKHILFYHSGSEVYISYLNLLRGIFLKKPQQMQQIYKMVDCTIPRHYGSYYDKPNKVPLNIQGGTYRMFADLIRKPEIIQTDYSESAPNKFSLSFVMSWKNIDGVTLKMDYQLYSYLYELAAGKLALSYENDKNLTFSNFVRALVDKCNCAEEVTIVKSDGTELKLSETAFGNIQLV